LVGKFYTRNSQRFPINVKYGDIVNGLPEKSESCDGIYCSHILEHLSYRDCLKALQNTFKLLKKGGVFRCVLPDLHVNIKKYLEQYETSNEPSNIFMRSTLLGVENRNKGIIGGIKNALGNSKHLWMWDSKTLIWELEKVGFSSIRPCKIGDSKDDNFKFVEEEGRFYNAIALECIK